MNANLLAIHIDSATHRDTCPHRLHNRRQRREARRRLRNACVAIAAILAIHGLSAL